MFGYGVVTVGSTLGFLSLVGLFQEPRPMWLLLVAYNAFMVWLGVDFVRAREW